MSKTRDSQYEESGNFPAVAWLNGELVAAITKVGGAG